MKLLEVYSVGLLPHIPKERNFHVCLGILGVSEDFGVECNRGIWKDKTTWNVFSAD